MTEFGSLAFDKQETVILARRVSGGAASASDELEHALRATSIVLLVDARSSAGGSLALTAEESDDGESWSEIEAVGTLTRTGSASLTVTPTLDWLRVAWEGGNGWTLDITATGHATIEAGNIGSGGGAPTLAEVLAEDGDPDGNSVTGALLIAPTDPTTPDLLTVQAPVGLPANFGFLLSMNYGTNGLIAASTAEYGGGNHASLFVRDDLDTSRQTTIDSNAGVDVNGTSASHHIQIRNDGDPVFRADAVRGVMTAVHAAPADGDLEAGQMAIWFDQTDGAAKLMVKAKTANGTVRTGSLNLS